MGKMENKRFKEEQNQTQFPRKLTAPVDHNEVCGRQLNILRIGDLGPYRSFRIDHGNIPFIVLTLSVDL